MASMISRAIGVTGEEFTEAQARVTVGETVIVVVRVNGLSLGDMGEVVDFHNEPQRDVFEVIVRFSGENAADPEYYLFGKTKYDRHLRTVNVSRSK